MATIKTDIEIRRAEDRGRTRIGWLDSAHSFSFGQYFDRTRMGYRSLRVINADRVAPGAGFGEHGHDNMEIITWVLYGALMHGDSLDNRRTLVAGEAQVMSAGRGIRHSEFNASTDDVSHFIQIWILPSEKGIDPRYDQRLIPAVERHNRFAVIASGRADHRDANTLPIHQDAAVLVADIDPGVSVGYEVGEGRGVYLHASKGRVMIDGHELEAGDAAVIERLGEMSITGLDSAQVLLFDLA